MRKLGDITTPMAAACIRTESPIEKLMLSYFMRNKRFVLVPKDQTPEGEGFFIYPQYEFGPFRADFLIHAVGYPHGMRVWPPKSEVKVVIECDGAMFHSTPDQKEHDAKRDKYFADRGIRTFRLTGAEIHKYGDNLVTDIENHLDNEVWGPRLEYKTMV